jgi:hypothetical protein
MTVGERQRQVPTGDIANTSLSSYVPRMQGFSAPLRISNNRAARCRSPDEFSLAE